MAAPYLTRTTLGQWIIEKKAGRTPDLADQQYLKELSNRDHLWLVDDAGSMQPRWDDVVSLFRNLAYLLKHQNVDGQQLEFTISEDRHQAKNTTTLVHYLEKRQLRGASDIALRLQMILGDYKYRLLRSRREKGRLTLSSAKVRPLTIYVLTDGVWDPLSDPSDIIAELIRDLDRLKYRHDMVGIQFIQFGADDLARERLQRLDEQSLTCDIVDTEPSDGNVLKMLLGSINRWFDNDTSYSPHLHARMRPVIDSDSDLDDEILDGYSTESISGGSSATSMEDLDERKIAFDTLLSFVTTNETLRPLFLVASQKSLLEATAFRHRLRRLILNFADELKVTASNATEENVVRFVAQNSRALALAVTDVYFPPDAQPQTTATLKQLRTMSEYPDRRYSLAAWLSRSIEMPEKLLYGKGRAEEEPTMYPPSFELTAPHGEMASDSLSKHSSSDASEDANPPSLNAMKEFLTGNHAFENLHTDLRRFVIRYIYDWTRIQTEWRRELLSLTPPELCRAAAPEVHFVTNEKSTGLDILRLKLEAFSGQQWNWWPFQPPIPSLAKEKVRVRWLCSCGRARWADVTQGLTLKIKKYIEQDSEQRFESLPNELSPGSSASRTVLPKDPAPSSSSASQGAVGTSTQGTQSANLSNSASFNTQPTLQSAPHTSTAQNQILPLERFVLLCVDRGGDLRHDQIRASDYRTDDEFFEEVLKRYKRLRGWWRYWLHPAQFSHCEVSRFAKFYVNRLGWMCDELPDNVEYEYIQIPPLKPYVSPVTVEEWRDRFHGLKTKGLLDSLPRIPKRIKRFQTGVHFQREEMWGLHVTYWPSFLIVMFWNIIISAGGWAFFAWWIKKSNGDLQTAGVPISLIMGAIAILWAPLSEKWNSQNQRARPTW